MNNVNIIVSETDDNPYQSLKVKNQFDIESYLGFLDDFEYSLVYKCDFIDSLPQKNIKLVLNICQLPHTPEIYVSNTLKNKINSDENTFLWIFSPHECTLDHNNFAISLKKQGFRLDKVIVTNSDYMVDGTKIAGVKYVSFPEWWECYYRHLLKTKKDISFTTPQERLSNLNSIEKKCLCLNRNVKIHRVWTYHCLLKTKLYQDSFYSYHVPSMANKDGLIFKDWIKKELQKNADCINPKKLEKNKEIFKDRKLDTIDSRYVINLQSSIQKYFEKSAVSIITESLDSHDFITEKTFKSIIHSHPFITIGGRGINSRLKERGYELFDNIFGEDHIDTPDKCYTVMSKLHSMSLNELIDYNLQTLTKIEHNYNHFFERKIYFRDVLDKIGKILYE